MSQEDISKNLKELLKIPLSQQDKGVYDQLSEYRKKLADEYYANFEKDGKKIYTCKYDRKSEIYQHLSELHKYFGMKEVNKPFPPNKGGFKKTVTKQNRADNVGEFLADMAKRFPSGYTALEDRDKIKMCAVVWGAP